MFCPKCGCELDNDAKFCEKCGAPVSGKPNQKVKGSGGGKVKKVMVPVCTVALLAAVVGVTVKMTGNFLNNITGDDTLNDNSAAVSSTAGGSTGTGNKSNDEYGKQMAKLFAQTYSCEWKVKKYTENGKTWKTYDLGKKMLIAAYNFLNDSTMTTGGNMLVGYTLTGSPSIEGTLCPVCKTGTFYRQTMFGSDFMCNACGNVQNDQSKQTLTPQYEWVPKQTTEYHGTDIHYDCPQITITANSVDMRGMGGTVYDIGEFRYEVSSDGNDRIVNDKYKFALEYDGRYLNYKEPDAYGYYVGYYAYDTTDSLVNITYVHDRSEFKQY